jgi:hypothetical protein
MYHGQTSVYRAAQYLLLIMLYSYVLATKRSHLQGCTVFENIYNVSVVTGKKDHCHSIVQATMFNIITVVIRMKYMSSNIVPP